MSSKKLKQDLEDKIKAFSLEGVRIILVKDPYVLDRLRNMRGLETKEPIHLVQVDEFDDLKGLSEKDLAAMGLVKKETKPLIHRV